MAPLGSCLSGKTMGNGQREARVSEAWENPEKKSNQYGRLQKEKTEECPLLQQREMRAARAPNDWTVGEATGRAGRL